MRVLKPGDGRKEDAKSSCRMGWPFPDGMSVQSWVATMIAGQLA